MALLVLASASAPAFAQDIPQCSTFFDNSQRFFTAAGAPDGAYNRQCFMTVMPKDGPNTAGFPNLSQYPQPQIMEGTYEIVLSGSGGAGAVPHKTTTYLSPGVYKLTLGTGGRGGGGAGYGNGGDGKSVRTADSDYQRGMKGGDGFVKLTPIQLAQATPVAAPVAIEPAPYVAPRAVRRDRN